MLLKRLIHKQRELIDYYFDHLDLKALERILEDLAQCKGVIFFSGIGKSGYIAQKAAALMQSTGTKAFFLSPVDALHGDLGMLSEEDHVIFLSKSGETDELLQLIPPVRNKGVSLTALTANSKSRLALSVDTTLILPFLHELCPFDLAPTLSTEIQLMICDLLAIALMERKKFTLEKYAENHPSGQIGKRALYRVQDLMLREHETPVCTPENTLKEILPTFSEKRCGCMVVVDENKRLQGIVTDGDLRRALQKEGPDVLKIRIEQLMTRAPRHIGPKDLAWEALKVMEANQKQPVTVLPVIEPEQQRVIGVLKMHDLIQAGL